MAAETGDVPVDGGKTVPNPNLDLPIRQGKESDGVTKDQALTGKQEHCEW